MFVRSAKSLLACVGLILAPAAAHAAERLRVSTEGCPQYSSQEIERLLSLELTAVAEGTDWTKAPSVAIFCGFGSVRILLGDHAGDRATSREIPAPRPDQPDAERIIALAASELVLAYMPEVAPPAPKPAPPPPAPAPPPEDPVAFSSVLFSGGAVLNNVEAPVGMARAALRGNFGLWRSLLVMAQFSYQYGVIKRSVGNVDIHAFFGEAGFAWRPLSLSVFHLDASFTGGGGVFLFEPVSTDPGYAPVPSQSPTIRLALGISPGWRVGPLELGLDFEGGTLLLRPDANTGPGSPVLLGGMFLSAAGHAGVAW